MAGSRRSPAVPPSNQAPPSVVRRSHSAAGHRRRGALGALTSTWEGGAVAGGAAVKAAVWLIMAALATPSRWLTVIDTLGSIALAAGGIGFFVRAIAIARRRLLWRVRRKLVISYIFIGVIPAVLIVAFFLLSGMLL